ncbi:Threonylcarbamoyl-AMP synthase [Acaryochloris thomasi RCC1774]|uniref:L-threonylcarbamoyladenylate synthase n=1 Tax=Acaryochloris thomasi RCC1774 TaxID=1764569 RepID=A0A2W1JPS6_9CYAN|nr:L-threonylcarbamoyladenylate synthase [Acaryochloris thomasi]PZD75323.1 Threonylcarbamoyl-AMP synthase [Acaryochloris thomasi RCC1774]
MTQVSIAALVAAARSGRLVSFPTDTVPALAACPTATHAIYAAKHRPADKPLILMAATPGELWPFVQGSTEEQRCWQQMAARSWPGAVTLVLPASDRIPPGLGSQARTIGLRVPQWTLTQIILQQTGPLATTSVNESNHPPLLSVAEIQDQFPDVLLSQDWPLPTVPEGQPPIPSTVMQWTGGSEWSVLRQGAARVEIL